LIAKSHRWRQTAITVATLSSLWIPSAMALSLGRITVQSALGEPLRAEVEILDINADETTSLRTTVAMPESFKAAGLEYNPAMANLQTSLQRRADGRAFIRLVGDRVINEPFVDMILETSWASGRIVREYTLLFDPPSLRATSAPAPIPALSSPPLATSRTSSVTPTPAPTLTASAPKTTRPAEPVKAASKALPPLAAGNGSADKTKQVTVKPGETASKIATTIRQDRKVSLDQMLVAMLRGNPAAFAGGNVNRIKAGSIVNVPSTEQALATPATEANQIIVAQSRDFNDFRRKLAVDAPDTTQVSTNRLASGSVQARVDDKKPVATAPDKLTLSGGAVQVRTAEDQVAKERGARDVANRAAEISKNISDLDKLGTASSVTASATPAASAPNAAVASPAPVVASAPIAGASLAVKRVPLPTPPPETGLLDSLIDSPLAPVGAISLLAVLAFFGIYRARRRKEASPLDSILAERPRHPADTYFAESGGQNVDTRINNAAGPSSTYAPSQLGGVDDVDPVAEAEVYLAYGRDLQAEEILKDAMRVSPERLTVHQKLLELFAKRRDVKSFAHVAKKAYRLTDGEGNDWERIRELGHSFDPDNPMYESGWRAAADAVDAPSAPAPLESSAPVTNRNGAASSQPATSPNGPSTDFDLDLDFSLDDNHSEAIQETSASVAETSPSALDPADGKAKSEPEPAVQSSLLGPIEFDLGSLSLDLEDSLASDAQEPLKDQDDPLVTKLALAREFIALGDDAGARTLLDEVIAESSGELKLRAQNALSMLAPK
jgi:pilus assembly protein FimV